MLDSKGRAALLTTMILLVAFGLQTLSVFKPVEYFAWIATSSIGTAFAANCLFLPALIIRLGSTVPAGEPERRP